MSSLSLAPFSVMKTDIQTKSSFEADALLFIEGFHCVGEGEVRLVVFHLLGRVRRTHKAEGGVRTVETNAERSILFQRISSYDHSEDSFRVTVCILQLVHK